MWAPARPYRDWIAERVLPANLDLHNAALKAARAAGNIMLDTSLQRNTDQWLGWIREFSYFTTHTAVNWAARTLQNPGVLADAANITNAVRRYNAQLAVDEQQERPKRYAQPCRCPAACDAQPRHADHRHRQAVRQRSAENEFADADTWGEQSWPASICSASTSIQS